MSQNVRLARCFGEESLRKAIEEKLNEGWTLSQVVFCGMGTEESGLIRGQKPRLSPVFIAIFTQFD